jgi:uncharacterized RDD family membrane protein YckC
VSDIPIGSPPAPPGRHAAPGGWYPDPAQHGYERYWDGWQWSRTTRPVESAAAPQGYPPQGYQAPYGQGPQPGQQYGSGYGQPAYGTPQLAGTRQVSTADQVPLAGWWARVVAVLIDTVILSALTLLATLPIVSRAGAAMAAYVREGMRLAQLGQQPPPFDAAAAMSVTDQLVISLVWVGLGFVYYTLLWRFRGAGVGQLALGLRVVPVDQGRYAGRLGWGPTLVRALIWTLPGLTTVLLIFQLVDVLFPLGQPKRQSLHDLAARTQVVKVRS